MFDYLPRSLELSVIMANRYNNNKIKYDGQFAWIEDKNERITIYGDIIKGFVGVSTVSRHPYLLG
jgi:hypothetical protein